MAEGKEFKNWLAERIKDRHAVHTARRVIAKEKEMKISSGYHVKDAYVFILDSADHGNRILMLHEKDECSPGIIEIGPADYMRIYEDGKKIC